MDFELNEEQELLRRTVRDFADRELAPRAAELDREGAWPGELVKRLVEMGLMGILVPTEKGGIGLDAVSYAIAMEEVSRGCASVGVIMSVHNSLVSDPILQFGSPEQHEKWLKPLAAGDILGCFALTEPASGSDASAMDTTAVRDGDHWVINGSKNFVTNAPHADLALVFATTTKGIGHKGTSCFIVPTSTPGFERSGHDDKVGIKAAQSCSLFFEQLRVPDSQRMGAEGAGFKVAMSTLDGGRIGIGAQALGIARAAFEKAVAYSKERKAFGGAISEKQAIQFKIADMAVALDAARLLIHRAAAVKDSKRRYTKEAAMAKLFASETAARVTHQSLQIFGGIGYTREVDAERHWRDARITEIYEGTSEIQRIVIAAQALKELG